MAIKQRTWTTQGGEERTAWIADFRDASGARRHKQFAKQAAAADWLLEARGKAKAGVFTPDSTAPTLEQAAEQWLAKGKRDGREAATLAGYNGHIQNHILPGLGRKTKVSKLTRPRIEEFIDQLLAAGRTRATTAKVVGSISAILHEAQRRGQLAQNVAQGARVTTGKRHKVKVVPPEPEAVKATLASATGRGKALLSVAALCGMRASEARGMRWCDCDFKAKLVRVRQRAATNGTIGSPKSSLSRRDLPMTPALALVLKEWLLASGGRADGDGLVFPGRRGRPLCHNTIMAAIGGRAHPYRHFYASWLIKHGFGPKKVQYLMGHSSIQMTFDVYGHLFKDDDDYERLAAAETALLG